jgi:hypothetical protein
MTNATTTMATKTVNRTVDVWEALAVMGVSLPAAVGDFARKGRLPQQFSLVTRYSPLH